MPALRTAVTNTFSLALTGNPNSIPANTTASVNFTSGNKALPSNFIRCTCPTLESGLVIADCYCTTKGTITVRIANVTVGAIDPASQTFYFVAF